MEQSTALDVYIHQQVGGYHQCTCVSLRCSPHVHTCVYCMCVPIITEPILRHTTCCSHSSSATSQRLLLNYLLFGRIAARLCRSLNVPLSRHWWHSSLDLAPNQRLFNVFCVIHEIGSIYEDLWKVSHLHLCEERVWVFQAPLSTLISLFHFGRGVYLGFKMWIIITPPKHIRSLRLDFRENIECCFFKALFVSVFE